MAKKALNPIMINKKLTGPSRSLILLSSMVFSVLSKMFFKTFMTKSPNIRRRRRKKPKSSRAGIIFVKGRADKFAIKDADIFSKELEKSIIFCMGTFYLKKYRICLMKYFLFVTLLFLLPFQLFGFDFKSITADYDVSYGILGKVGHAKATIEIKKGAYKIRIEAKGKGIASVFSRGRIEVYESTGLVVEGKLLPTLFVKDRLWGDKKERKRYFFNHDKKSVTMIVTSVNGGKVHEAKEVIPFYAKEDILTLFFNLESTFGKSLLIENKTDFIAVGANNQNGTMSVQTPSGKNADEIKKLLNRDERLLMIILNQKFFASKNGEFFINVNDDGICDRLILKDVVMYGDLVGKIKNVEIKK